MFIVPDVDKIKKKLIEEFDFDAASSLAVVTTKDILLKNRAGVNYTWVYFITGCLDTKFTFLL